jgi:xanthine dehydrogenase accessory factor
VTLLDPRPGYAARARFPEAFSVLVCEPEEAPLPVDPVLPSAAVLMTHNYGLDRRFLPVLLRAPFRYVGLLGPRSRAGRLRADLADEGFRPTEDQLRRLHAPAGLDTGAETPDEIALSILAEIRAALQGRTGEPLRNRPGPIHPRGEAAVPSEPAGWPGAEEDHGQWATSAR